MNVDNAIETCINNIECLNNIIEIDILDSLTYVLSENIISNVNVPNYRISMRDGYALKYHTNIDKYNIIDKNIYAGNNIEHNYNTDYDCFYITTGAIVPDCTDTIVMIENVSKNNNKLFINTDIKCGEYIRDIGSDITKDNLVLSKDSVINSAAIATLISIGIKKVKVYKKPIIGILSSGNEVIDYTFNKKDNQIYDLNRPIFKSYLNNYDIIDYGIVNDNYFETKNQIIHILNNVDLLITSGGISMGDKDYIKPILKELGNIYIEKLNMKPGKPFIFSKINNKIIFSLPGNPVSTNLTFLFFVLPSIKLLYGLKWQNPVQINAILRNDIIADNTRTEYIRGIVSNSIKYSKFFVDSNLSNNNSSNISSMINSNCLIETHAGNNLKTGDLVKIHLIDDINKYDDTILNIGILTTSDRASAKLYDDISGIEIKTYINNNIYNNNYKIFYMLIPDDINTIKDSLKIMTDNLCCNLILTTGGTGPSNRDVTDLATTDVCHKLLPGFGEIMRINNFNSVPTSILSAQTAGIRYLNSTLGSLIINLPGKPEAIKECLDIIFKSIPKCLKIINSPDLILL